jgi:hypothetical protein
LKARHLTPKRRKRIVGYEGLSKCFLGVLCGFARG